MGLIIILLIGALFFYKAKKNDLNKWLWTVIGVGSFFIGIIVGALVMVVIDTNIVSNEISDQTLWISGASGLLNSIFAWMVMQSKINDQKW